jgi:hypothetical protein
MLPLTYASASANQNEKKHSLTIMEKTKLILKHSAAEKRDSRQPIQQQQNQKRH